MRHLLTNHHGQRTAQLDDRSLASPIRWVRSCHPLWRGSASMCYSKHLYVWRRIVFYHLTYVRRRGCSCEWVCTHLGAGVVFHRASLHLFRTRRHDTPAESSALGQCRSPMHLICQSDMDSDGRILRRHLAPVATCAMNILDSHSENAGMSPECSQRS